MGGEECSPWGKNQIPGCFLESDYSKILCLCFHSLDHLFQIKPFWHDTSLFIRALHETMPCYCCCCKPLVSRAWLQGQNWRCLLNERAWDSANKTSFLVQKLPFFSSFPSQIPCWYVLWFVTLNVCVWQSETFWFNIAESWGTEKDPSILNCQTPGAEMQHPAPDGLMSIFRHVPAWFRSNWWSGREHLPTWRCFLQVFIPGLCSNSFLLLSFRGKASQHRHAEDRLYPRASLHCSLGHLGTI